MRKYSPDSKSNLNFWKRFSKKKKSWLKFRSWSLDVFYQKWCPLLGCFLPTTLCFGITVLVKEIFDCVVDSKSSPKLGQSLPRASFMLQTIIRFFFVCLFFYWLLVVHGGKSLQRILFPHNIRLVKFKNVCISNYSNYITFWECRKWRKKPDFDEVNLVSDLETETSVLCPTCPRLLTSLVCHLLINRKCADDENHSCSPLPVLSCRWRCLLHAGVRRRCSLILRPVFIQDKILRHRRQTAANKKRTVRK